MQIFFSWQADSPNRIGRTFIREALDRAVLHLAEELELEDADRPDVDQDTQGVLGAPPIAETILEKIQDCDVIVSDVTLVGQVHGGEKKLINSNVAYELGYAHGNRGDEIMLKVMNIHYGEANELPFDLQHRRWPICYDLSPEAEAEERTVELERFSGELLGVLRLYWERRGLAEEQEEESFAYWEDDDIIATKRAYREYPEMPMSLRKDSEYVLIKVSPAERLDPIRAAELHELNIYAMGTALDRSRGMDTGVNRYGRLVFYSEPTGMCAWTEVLFNREIWGVNTEFMEIADEHGRFIPLQALEAGFLSSIRSYLDFAYEYLGYTREAAVTLSVRNPVDAMILWPGNIIGHDRRGPLHRSAVASGRIGLENRERNINNLIVDLTDDIFEAATLPRGNSHDLLQRIEE